MEDRVTQLLRCRDTTLAWSEPWPGINEEGESCYAPVDLRATVSDCINTQREMLRALGKDYASLSDAQLLTLFLEVFWAQPVEDVGDAKTAE
jgi:hypothetical protein